MDSVQGNLLPDLDENITEILDSQWNIAQCPRDVSTGFC